MGERQVMEGLHRGRSFVGSEMIGLVGVLHQARRAIMSDGGLIQNHHGGDKRGFLPCDVGRRDFLLEIGVDRDDPLVVFHPEFSVWPGGHEKGMEAHFSEMSRPGVGISSRIRSEHLYSKGRLRLQVSKGHWLRKQSGNPR